MKVVVMALILSLVTICASATVPAYINYQGKLSNGAGQPLSGDQKLTFRVYDAPVGGTLMWGPQIFDGLSGQGHGALVPVVQGNFNVILGSHDTGGRAVTDAFKAGPRYLEIAVGESQPISPRQQVLSAPFAVSSDFVRGQDIVMNLATVETNLNSRINTAVAPPVAVYNLTASQSAPVSTSVRINFATKVADTHNAVTTGSNWKFTVPVTGLYQLNVWVETNIVGYTLHNDNHITIRNSRNPTAVFMAKASFDWDSSISSIVQLNANETIWFEFAHSSHASALIDGHFSIALLYRQ